MQNIEYINQRSYIYIKSSNSMQTIMHEFPVFEKEFQHVRKALAPSFSRLQVIQIPRSGRNLPPSWMWSFVLGFCVPNLRYKKELAVNENHKYPVYIHFSPVSMLANNHEWCCDFLEIFGLLQEGGTQLWILSKASFYHIFYLSKTSCKLWSGRCSVGKLGEYFLHKIHVAEIFWVATQTFLVIFTNLL